MIAGHLRVGLRRVLRACVLRAGFVADLRTGFAAGFFAVAFGFAYRLSATKGGFFLPDPAMGPILKLLCFFLR